MILAGDVGGTKTLLGLFDPRPPRPQPIVARTFVTLDYRDLAAVIGAFRTDTGMADTAIEAACFGVAGPVVEQTARLTNVPWHVDARELAKSSGIGRVTLLNDLQAMAYAVPVLDPAELHVLQEGSPVADGNMALIAAGTGLGEALLHHVGGRFVPSPSEGGHADFAARTEREVAVLRNLVRQYGRAEVEQVVSGPGLVNLHRVTHTGPCAAVTDTSDRDAPAAITTAALERRCAGCTEALGMFVEAYGAEAGNLALRMVATAGLFVGGGIALKTLPALNDGRFMQAFRDKAPLGDMMTGIPVKVILNPEPGLLGAAVYAATA